MDNLHQRLIGLKEDGRGLIGCFPLYPPVELFHALGLTPLVMWGLKAFFPQTARSDQHLQNYTCSVGRHLTEFVLSEAGALLDGLFMYNACDTLRNLPEILRCGLEDRGRKIPLLNIHVPMALRGGKDKSLYLENEIGTLIKGLESAFDVFFSEKMFEESVRLYGRARDLTRRLERAASDGRLGFRKFANLVQGNYFRTVERQITALESALSEAGKAPSAASGQGSGGRVILSGILPPPAGVCSVIEESGLKVVGNDIASLARSYHYTPETNPSPAEYFVDFYFNHHACTTLLGSADDRIAALEALIEERQAEGVIFIGEKFCEYEYFEFPYLERRFKQKGLHTLLLEFAIDDDQNLGAFRTRIEAFAELMI